MRENLIFFLYYNIIFQKNQFVIQRNQTQRSNIYKKNAYGRGPRDTDLFGHFRENLARSKKVQTTMKILHIGLRAGVRARPLAYGPPNCLTFYYTTSQGYLSILFLKIFLLQFNYRTGCGNIYQLSKYCHCPFCY